MKNLNIFKFKIPGEDFKKIKSLDELKFYLLDHKIIHNKYKNKIKDMEFNDLKNFLFTGYYESQEFEGIAPLLTAINHKDITKIFKIIKDTNLYPMSFLRLIIFAVQNYDLYRDNKLGFYIKNFKLKFELKFKRLLIDMGKKSNIDKLDLLIFFNKLLNF